MKIKNKNLFETLVGFIILLVAISFYFYARNTSKVNIDSNSYKIHAKFNQIDGISTGSDVRIAGIKIGSVLSEKLDRKTYEASLTLSIKKSISLPTDSTAKIVSSGLLGKKYISIEPGADEENIPPKGSIIYTQSSVNLETLIGKFMFQKSKK